MMANITPDDPSEIILICWFFAQETFLIIINIKNSCAASSYFCGNCIFFFQDTLIEIIESIYLKYKHFVLIINVHYTCL